MNKIIFLGTPDFAVPTLKKLNEDKNIEISFVVTKNDTIKSRGHGVDSSDIKKEAIKLGLKVLQTDNIKKDKIVLDEMKNANPDFIVVVAFGQILSKEILDIPKKACINGHASLLPKYRGSSPIQNTILNGDKVAGTTSMLMAEKMDTGDILLQKVIDLNLKETTYDLFLKLSFLTADCLIETINNFDNIIPKKQDEKNAVVVSMIKKEDGKIDFNEDAIIIERKIRAYNPWPSAYINFNDKILKIFDADVIDDVNLMDSNVIDLKNGLYIVNNVLIAKTKNKFLLIKEVQLEGKKRMSANSFLNGLKK